MPLQGAIFRCLLMKQKKLAHKKPPTFHIDLFLWNSQAISKFQASSKDLMQNLNNCKCFLANSSQLLQHACKFIYKSCQDCLVLVSLPNKINTLEKVLYISGRTTTDTDNRQAKYGLRESTGIEESLKSFIY